ncbi:MAG: formimidoylglutamase [Acidobacteria bacterium]|nr:formimidoylglutamase [Acidobacteriota bacterium]
MNWNVFDHTIRPDPSVFHSRNDALDRRLGEAVARTAERYDDADVVILGCPQDVGVRRNRGRAGARGAPDAIRRMLYTFPVTEKISRHALFDLGDVSVDGSLEEIHQRQRRIVRQLLADGKTIVVLGGGNDISYPDGRALAQVVPDCLAFNIDSHFDVRADEPRNSGTPYRQLMEGGFLLPANFYELAVKEDVNAPAYRRYVDRKGVHVFTLEEMRQRDPERLVSTILKERRAGAIFWGFDLDAVRTVDAPGVSATYPIGLTADEICTLARLAGSDARSRILEISEVNPRYDVDRRTCRLAAMMIIYFLGAMP